jgi:hypothetical protein
MFVWSWVCVGWWFFFLGWRRRLLCAGPTDEGLCELLDPARAENMDKWCARLKQRNSRKTYVRELMDRPLRVEHRAFFQSVKDFAECAAAIAALRAQLPVVEQTDGTRSRPVWRDKCVVCYVLGDGRHPQCASLLSTYTSDWTIHSIDPMLDTSAPVAANVHLHAIRSEKFRAVRSKASLSVVLAVHSHAPLDEFWRRLPANRPKIAIALPCCVRQYVPGLSPVLTYRDEGLWSSCNGVAVWKTS